MSPSADISVLTEEEYGESSSTTSSSSISTLPPPPLSDVQQQEQEQQQLPTRPSSSDGRAVRVVSGRGYRYVLPFPYKLHEMLEEVDKAGGSAIVSWLDNGKAFKVHQADQFVKKIVPLYFKQRQYKSFQRQLHLYGFRRFADGPSKGAYYHQYFIREDRHLSHQMTRKMTGGAGESNKSPLQQAKEKKFGTNNKMGGAAGKAITKNTTAATTGSTTTPGPTAVTSTSTSLKRKNVPSSNGPSSSSAPEIGPDFSLSDHWSKELAAVMGGRTTSSPQELDPKEEVSSSSTMDRSPSLERFETLLKELQSNEAPPRPTKKPKLYQHSSGAAATSQNAVFGAPPTTTTDCIFNLGQAPSKFVPMSNQSSYNQNIAFGSFEHQLLQQQQEQAKASSSSQQQRQHTMLPEQQQLQKPQQQDQDIAGTLSWLVNDAGMTLPDLARMFPMDINSSTAAAAATTVSSDSDSQGATRVSSGSSSSSSSTSSSSMSSSRSYRSSSNNRQNGGNSYPMPSSSSSSYNNMMNTNKSPKFTDDFLSLFQATDTTTIQQQQQQHVVQPQSCSSVGDVMPPRIGSSSSSCHKNTNQRNFASALDPSTNLLDLLDQQQKQQSSVSDYMMPPSCSNTTTFPTGNIDFGRCDGEDGSSSPLPPMGDLWDDFFQQNPFDE